MDRAQLFQHFEALAGAPGAVPKLRELVLQLAIRGQLLSQDLNDAAAQKWADATRRLADAGLPEIDSDDTPFALPKGWAWLRIGEAMRLFNGRAFKPSDWGNTGLPIVRIQNLNKPDAAFNYCNFDVGTKVLIKNDDLLISWSGTPGTSFGAFIWNRGPAVLNQHIFRAELIGDAYEKRFLRLAINGRLDEMISKAHGAVGLQHITKGKLELMVLPVPPRAEQDRILAKVEELMVLCDELEARQIAARENRTRLVRSALDHLTAAKDEADFKKHSAFCLQHSELLFDSVPALRQAILSLAVQGRLVGQNSADENGQKLVERILKERGLHSSNDVEPEMPTIPKTWAAVSMSDVFDIVGGLQKTPIRTPRNHAFPYLRVANVQRGRLVLDDVQRFELTDGELARLRLQPNDLLVVEGNGSEDEIGRCAQWNGEIPDCVHQNHIIRCRPIGHDARYAILFLNSPPGIAEMKQRAITTSGLFSLSVGKIRSLPIPIPPLAEQTRIVAKVDELMRWCDALEARLADAQTTATNLLDASLHQLLAQS